MEYHPWKLTRSLYSQRGTKIYETTDSRWVIKVTEDDARSLYELQILLRILAAPPRHSIKPPPSTYGLYGRTPMAGWYAMKRYDGCVERNAFCTTHWRTLAIHVLQFIQDLHHDHRLVHMDIKKTNILVDTDNTEFVVADYEHAESPDSSMAVTCDDDHLWYYMSMGAELYEPVFAWRFDLVALGYLLASLTVEPNDWTFEQECWEKRHGRGQSQEMVLALRTSELAGLEPAVQAYMRRIMDVAWDAPAPPSRAFYRELEALFDGAKIDTCDDGGMRHIR